MSTLDERVRDLEVTMWGARGDNGIRSQVRAIQTAVDALPEKFRDELEQAVERIEGRDEHSRNQRWAIIALLVTVSVTFLGSVITALATVLH